MAISKAAICRSFSLAFLLASLSACGALLPTASSDVEPAALPEGAFRLDADHAALVWKVEHLGYSLFVGRFNELDATLDFDPEAVENSSLAVTVDAASIDTGNPELDDILRGSGWLDTAAHPQIRFYSTAIQRTGERTGRVDGFLDLHGVEAPITLDVTFNGSGSDFLRGGRDVLGFSATGELTRSTFAIDTLVPAVGDTVRIEIEAEFVSGG
ncbi:MAG: YceI family protein [Geminicoccaceae bacterium]